MARILVIDDDVQIREMLTQFFERFGYEVMAAQDGNVGLKAHAAHPADLIITDIIMPEKEGIETIGEFRKRYPEVKIVAMSGGGKIEAHQYLNTARALGAQMTFSKPLDLAEVLQAVRNLLCQMPGQD